MSNITPIVWTAEEPVEEDHDSKEDGELSSHGDSDIDELVDVDYHILPRPPIASTEGGMAIGSSDVDRIQSMDCNNVGGGPNLDYSDDENSSKNGSSSDTDSDEPMSKKKSFGKQDSRAISSKSNNTTFVNPNAFNNPYGVNKVSPPTVPFFPNVSSSVNPLPEGVIDADISTIEQKMMSYQEKRKSKDFSIWSKVLQEEEQQAILDKFGDVDVHAKVVVERGPETYAFKPAPPINRKRKRNVPGSHKKNKKEKQKKDNDSDFSSAGLSDDDLEYLKCCANTTPPFPVNPNNIDEGSSSAALDMEDEPPSLEEIQKTINRLRGRKLCYYMANQLQERKCQLIVRACEILGKRYCMRMFLKTMKIEKQGGLLIKSKTRRRTPGGVFFYMLRNDDKFPSEKIDLIFELDKEIVKREKKIRVRARFQEGKAELEKFQHRHVKMRTIPMDSKKTEGTEDGEVSDESDYAEYHSDESDFGDTDSEGSDTEQRETMEGDEQVHDYLELACPTNDLDDM